MATPHKLRALEAERGNLERIIPPLVNQFGQAGAAHKLGVSPATISLWLKENNYVGRTSWMKDTTPEEKASIQRAADRVNAHRRAHGLPTLEEEATS